MLQSVQYPTLKKCHKWIIFYLPEFPHLQSDNLFKTQMIYFKPTGELLNRELLKTYYGGGGGGGGGGKFGFCTGQIWEFLPLVFDSHHPSKGWKFQYTLVHTIEYVLFKVLFVLISAFMYT